MVLNGPAFSALLQTLSLTQGLFKPDPGAFNSFAVADNNATNSPTSNPSSVPGGHVLSDITGTGQQYYEAAPESYAAPPLANQSFPPFDPAMANLYRYRQQQSVNLGSWFVHENWMTPSLFKSASGKKLSELDIASGWGSPDSARSVLEHHWDTFINQSDFQYLASIGINTVRLPIGYWNLGPYYCQDTPFASVADVYQSSWIRIVRAINWAADAGIGVLVDLHGAVGSQNGQPHSGISDGATNMFSSSPNMDKTIDVLVFLMQQLATVTNVVGIQILNEPKNLPELTDFYTRAITSMRQAPTPAALSLPLYVHDGFDLQRFSDYVANRTDFVVQDHHSYFVFTPSDEREPASQHTIDIQGPISDMLAGASQKQRRNLVVDEWSCALTPQSISQEPNKDQARKDFGKGQMDVYTNTTAGWSFWSYTKEDCEGDPGWCFKAAVNHTLPATFFSYDQAPITDLWKSHVLATSIANMTVPSDSDISARTQTNDVLAASPQSQKQLARRLCNWSRFPSFHHRFEAIYQRRRSKRDTLDGLGLTAAQRSIKKGYSDGFTAAKTFALFRLSKLGFIGQYITDCMAQQGPSVVAPGTEQNYHESFVQGLVDGQGIVASIVNFHSGP